jgi:hypothetical protein
MHNKKHDFEDEQLLVYQNRWTQFERMNVYSKTGRRQSTTAAACDQQM